MLYYQSGEKSDIDPNVVAIQEMLRHLRICGLQRSGSEMPTPSDVEINGIYDKITASAVAMFQELEGLLCDGELGAQTMAALQKAKVRHDQERAPITEIRDIDFRNNLSDDQLEFAAEPVTLARADTNRAEIARQYDSKLIGDLYVTLREDVAEKFVRVRDKINENGGLMTCGASLRDPSTPLSAFRSGTSFHCLGRAFDLNFMAGMRDPKQDPHVISWDQNEGWRVWSRAEDGARDATYRELANVVTYAERSASLRTTGWFIDLTSLLAEHGFRPIRPKPGFFEGGSILSADWYHFHNTDGLVEGESTFGHELATVTPIPILVRTPVWARHALVYGNDWAPPRK